MTDEITRIGAVWWSQDYAVLRSCLDAFHCAQQAYAASARRGRRGDPALYEDAVAHRDAVARLLLSEGVVVPGRQAWLFAVLCLATNSRRIAGGDVSYPLPGPGESPR